MNSTPIRLMTCGALRGIATILLALYPFSPSHAQQPVTQTALASTIQNAQASTQDATQFAQSVKTAAADAMDGNATQKGQAIHWVLLVDTSQYQATAPVVAAQGQVQEALYQAAIRSGDHVSVVPFQLHPNWDAAWWDQPVARYEDLRPHIPVTTFSEGHSGGRDIEAAVKAALARLRADNQLGQAVILVLTASRFSEVPTGEPHYILTTERDPDLMRNLNNAHETATITLVPIPTLQKGGDKIIDLYPRVYIPHPLTGIGSLPQADAPHPAAAQNPKIISPVKAPVWPKVLLALLILAGAALIIWLYHRWKDRSGDGVSSRSPLLILEHTNRNFPASGRIDVYGPGFGNPVEGSAQEPSQVGIEHPDLSPASHGRLFTLQTDGRRGVIALPNLYTIEPGTLSYNKETSVMLRPAGGTEGFPVRTTMTIQQN